MALFDDKKYEELDWISQAVEPIQTELNNFVSAIPDEYVVTYDQLYFHMTNHGSGFDFRHAMSFAARNVNMSADAAKVVRTCFRLEVDPNTQLDLQKRVLTGSVKLVKIAETIDQDVLTKSLGIAGLEQMWSNLHYSRDDFNSRLAGVLELIGKCDEGLRSRSQDRRLRLMHKRLREVFSTNEWNIKDYELANRVPLWISAYLLQGNLAALNNFCKLKVMTHKGLPIYSMEEETI